VVNCANPVVALTCNHASASAAHAVEIRFLQQLVGTLLHGTVLTSGVCQLLLDAHLSGNGAVLGLKHGGTISTADDAEAVTQLESEWPHCSAITIINLIKSPTCMPWQCTWPY